MAMWLCKTILSLGEHGDKGYDAGTSINVKRLQDDVKMSFISNYAGTSINVKRVQDDVISPLFIISDTRNLQSNNAERLFRLMILQTVDTALIRPEWLGTDMTRLSFTLGKMDDCFSTFR